MQNVLKTAGGTPGGGAGLQVLLLRQFPCTYFCENVFLYSGKCADVLQGGNSGKEGL